MRNAKQARGHHGPKRTGNGSPVSRGMSSWATNGCSTGKRAWMQRADAKAYANRSTRSGFDKLRPYRCDECGLWHLGHLPTAVLDGYVTRGEYYGGDAA